MMARDKWVEPILNVFREDFKLLREKSKPVERVTKLKENVVVLRLRNVDLYQVRFSFNQSFSNLLDKPSECECFRFSKIHVSYFSVNYRPLQLSCMNFKMLKYILGLKSNAAQQRRKEAFFIRRKEVEPSL